MHQVNMGALVVESEDIDAPQRGDARETTANADRLQQRRGRVGDGIVPAANPHQCAIMNRERQLTIGGSSSQQLPASGQYSP